MLADTSIMVVLELPFFTFSKADIQFVEKTLFWKSYIATDTQSITKGVELIDIKNWQPRFYTKIRKLL